MGRRFSRALWLALAVFGTGCATTAPCSEEARIETLHASCQHGCSCEKQCELDFLTCPFSEGACVTANTLCRQNCGAPLQASATLARPTRAVTAPEDD